jgi:hypothetical protein
VLARKVLNAVQLDPRTIAPLVQDGIAPVLERALTVANALVKLELWLPVRNERSVRRLLRASEVVRVKVHDTAPYG